MACFGTDSKSAVSFAAYRRYMHRPRTSSDRAGASDHPSSSKEAKVLLASAVGFRFLLQRGGFHLSFPRVTLLSCTNGCWAVSVSLMLTCGYFGLCQSFRSFLLICQAVSLPGQPAYCHNNACDSLVNGREPEIMLARIKSRNHRESLHLAAYAASKLCKIWCSIRYPAGSPIAPTEVAINTRHPV